MVVWASLSTVAVVRMDRFCISLKREPIGGIGCGV